MNRNYKVIWNASLNCFMAVSEYAKARGKSSKSSVSSNATINTTSTLSSTNAFRLTAIGLGLMAAGLTMSPQVFAVTGVGNGVTIGLGTSNCSTAASTAGTSSVAVGCGSIADTTNTGITFYDRVNPYNTTVDTATGRYYSVAVGTQAKAFEAGTSVGMRAESGELGVAFGAQAKSRDVAAVAIGPAALADGNTALALGRQSAATADFAQAIGNVSAATGIGSLAIGHSATAIGSRSIAIGAADIGTAGSTGDQAGVKYQMAERTYSTGKDSIALGAGANSTKDYALAIGAKSKADGNNSTAIGFSSQATGIGSFAIGAQSKALATNALALGGSAEADKVNSIAVGVNAKANFINSVALGTGSQVLHNNSTAIGDGSTTNAYSQTAFLYNSSDTGAIATGAVSVGKGTGTGATNERRLQNVAAGALDTDGVNVSQLKKYTVITNAAIKASKTEVKAGTNVNVPPAATGNNGQSIYTVNANGTTVSSADSGALMVTPGIKDTNNVTDYKVDLGADTKASLDSADNALQTVITQIDGVAVKTITKTNNTANFLKGDNILLTPETGGGIKVALANTVNLGPTGSVTTGNTVMNNTGFTFLGGTPTTTVSLTSNGLNNGGKQITNVASGVGNVTNAANIGDIQTIAGGLKTEVVKGTNVTSVTKSTALNGKDTYTVNANGTTVSSADSGALMVTPGIKDTNNVTDYKVDLGADTKASLDSADNALQTVITQIDGVAVKTITKTNNTANFLKGDNILLTPETGGGIKVALANTVNLGPTGSVTTGNTVMNNTGFTFLGGTPTTTVSLTSNGLNNGGKQITNVASGVGNVTNAANIGDIQTIAGGLKTEVVKGTNVTSVTKSTALNGKDTYTVNANGTTVSSADSGALMVTPGIKDTNNVTDYKVDLGADTKASLDSADNALQTVITQIDGVAVKTITKTNNTANFLKGDNILLTPETGGGIKVALANTVNLGPTGSVTTGNTVMNNTGFTFLGGTPTTTVSLTSNGLNNGGKQITNVASGVGNVTNAANIGDIQTIAGGLKTEVVKGTNVTSVTKSTALNGKDTYTVNANGTTVSSADSGALMVTPGIKDTNNVTDYKVDLGADTKASLDSADNALQTVITQIDGVAVKTITKTNNTANFLKGDNILLTPETGGGIKVATAQDMVLNSVKMGNTTVSKDGMTIVAPTVARTVVLSSAGLNNGGNKITNVLAGTQDTDAVNVKQLNLANTTIDKGLSFGGDSGDPVNRKLGETLTVKGGDTINADPATKNISVTANGKDTLTVRLAKDINLGNTGSLTTGNTQVNNAGITLYRGDNDQVALTNNGLNNGNNKITNVAEGTTGKDAVNFDQLSLTNTNVSTNAAGIKTNKDAIALGIKIGDGNSANDQQFALGSTINVTGDSNITTTASATGVQVKLNNQLNLGDDGRMQMGNSIMNNTGFTFVGNEPGRTVILGAGGLNNGFNRITNVAAGLAPTDAATVGQLSAATFALDKGWALSAQGDEATMVKQGSAFDLNSRDGNIKISRTAAASSVGRVSRAVDPNDMTFDLNRDIAIDSVQTGDTTINNEGLTIVGGPSVTKAGINAADTKVTNVVNGEVAANSKDAINGGQLYAQGAGISSIIGGNTTYDPVTGTFTNSNIGGTGQASIDGAIASIKRGEAVMTESIQTNTTNITTNTSNITKNTANIATNTANISTNTTNIKANKDKIDAGLNFGADSGAVINKPIGDGSVMSFKGGNNIKTTAEGSSIKFDLNGNINVESVTTGNTTVNNSGVTIKNGPSMTAAGIYAGNTETAPSMTAAGINAAGTKVTNVADGMAPRDAVNYGQLEAVTRGLGGSINELGYKIGEVEDDANAGISAAMAMSSLPQAYIIGKPMIGGGIATFNGESAVAIGFSKMSNDGRWVMKLNGTADTQGNVGGAIGAGFHFD
ncbi:ESPR-type extended signal peptide-containing protein [Psychrobacter faecalis]|uniref:ESPR-type extended signal peptide-containing protein n=1 Tax=Psychrobacter faecalis TaxID=180588 RepID=UPI003FD1EA40